MILQANRAVGTFSLPAKNLKKATADYADIADKIQSGLLSALSAPSAV